MDEIPGERSETGCEVEVMAGVVPAISEGAIPGQRMPGDRRVNVDGRGKPSPAAHANVWCNPGQAPGMATIAA